MIKYIVKVVTWHKQTAITVIHVYYFISHKMQNLPNTKKTPQNCKFKTNCTKINKITMICMYNVLIL